MKGALLLYIIRFLLLLYTVFHCVLSSFNSFHLADFTAEQFYF